MKEKLLTLEKFDRAKAWIEAALQDLQRTLSQHDVHVYRELTGTAAVTATPYTHAKWDVVDESVTEYRDGMVVCVKVPVAGHGTYGTGLQINTLGYKPVVYNVNSMVSTRYGVGAVVWAVYNATQTASLYVNSASASTITGCWQVQDYDANTNTIGYQLRTNSSTRPVSSATYRYRLMFSSLDNSKWVPATNSTSSNATSARTVNQEVINPWGRIVYYSTTSTRTAGQTMSATAQWDRYIFNLGYSFNTGSALALTFPGPVYIKCTPQSGGGAIIDSTTPYVQSLPSTADGKIYIYLGQAYSASEVELIDYHPVYYHDGTKIALWTDTKGFSGNYNDLTNKPTIPDAVSGVNDGTNWTSLTIGNTTKAIPQGGGGGADWAENDSTAAGYVANRTHWSEISVAHTCDVTTQSDLSVTTSTRNGVTRITYHGYNPTNLYGQMSDAKQSEFEFIINGVTYKTRMDYNYTYAVDGSSSIIRDVYDYNSGTLTQDMYSIFGSYTYADNMDMWLYLYFPASVLSSVTSFVIKRFDEEVHKLDIKYLPDTKVDWNESDSSSNSYIKNRTHWKYKSYSSTHYLNQGSENISVSSDSQNGVTRIQISETTEGALDWLFKEESGIEYFEFMSAPGEYYGVTTRLSLSSIKKDQDGSYYVFYTGDDIYYSDCIMWIYDGSESNELQSGMFYVTAYTGWPYNKIDIYIPTSDLNGDTYFSLAITCPNYEYQPLDKRYLPTNLHDFTYNSIEATNGSASVSFEAGKRNAILISATSNFTLSINDNNNSCDNYIWIQNDGSSQINVSLSIYKNYMMLNSKIGPSGGITVAAGKVCELRIIVFDNVAFISPINNLSYL